MSLKIILYCGLLAFYNLSEIKAKTEMINLIIDIEKII